MTMREKFNSGKDSWFRDDAQRWAAREIIKARLADDRYQEECRYLMRFWWHLEMPYQEVSYIELRNHLSEQKLEALEALFDVIDTSYQRIDVWLQRYSLLDELGRPPPDVLS